MAPSILAAPNTSVEDYGRLQPLVQALSAANDPTIGKAKFATLYAQMKPKAGDLDDLMDELNNIENGPSGSTDQNKAPPATTVCIMPYDREAAKDNYITLMDANSIVQLYTSITSAKMRQDRGHPAPYDITNPSEAAQAFADQASAAYEVMSGFLAGYFNYSSGLVNTMSKSTSKTNLHLEFLNEVFSGFNLGTAAKNVLDGVLTKFIESVANFSLSTENTNNKVSHSLRILQCARINITGDEDGEGAEYVYQPRVKIVYMRLDNSTWSWSTNKADHSESKFEMNYVIADFDLNVNKFNQNKDQLEKVWKTVSDKTMSDWSKAATGDPLYEEK